MIGFAIFLFIILFIGMVVYCWYRLHKEVFIHAANNADTPDKYHLPFESVSFSAQDGLRLSGWFIPVEHPKAVVILVHGRSVTHGGKSTMIDHALYLYENGYTTLLFDMRGFGDSEGKRIGFGEKEWIDVLTAYTYMKSREENKNTKIGFLGISVGGSAALIATGKKKIGDFVIACVPYATHASLFAYQVSKERIFPKFLFTTGLLIGAFFILGFDYFLQEANQYIAKIQSPLLLMSAKKDETVNPKDAWKLYEKANKPKEYWEADALHDVYKEKKEEFQNKVLRFLQIYAV